MSAQWRHNVQCAAVRLNFDLLRWKLAPLLLLPLKNVHDNFGFYTSFDSWVIPLATDERTDGRTADRPIKTRSATY